MQRVEAASGAKYAAHNEKPRKWEPIAPVGTSYTPIGRPDMAALRRVPPAPGGASPSAATSAAKPPGPTAPRPVFGAPVAAPVKTAPPRNAPEEDWGDAPAARPPPPPAASRPPAVPTAPRPAPTSVSVTREYCTLSLDTLLLQGVYARRTPRAIGACVCRVLTRAHQTRRGGSHHARRASSAHMDHAYADTVL